MSNLPPEDKLTNELTSPQIRDFANRVLLRAAVRLGGTGWSEFEHETRVNNRSLGVDRFTFTAKFDEDERIFDYQLAVLQARPMNGEWRNEEMVKQILLPRIHREDGEVIEDDSSKVLIFYDEDGEEVDDRNSAVAIGYRGFVGIERNFDLIVPIGKALASARKSVDFIFLDEETNPVNSESVYFDDSSVDEVEVAYLENLVRFSEPCADVRSYENDFSKMTTLDLAAILQILKAAHLIAANTVMLRKDLVN